MGLCESADSGKTKEEKDQIKADKDRTKKINQQLGESKEKDQIVNKLLLLGAGESGKSTLFKQMITIYGQGFREEDRKGHYCDVIYANMITSIKTLCEQSKTYTAVTEKNKENSKTCLQYRDDVQINDSVGVGAVLKALWEDSGIQATYENRSKFQLSDSTSYYFAKIDEIVKSEYIPTEQDVLRTRVPTTGIIENEFEIDGNSFKMFDVGGQRSERKKWIHCFENVTAVLFVAAISAYDQVLYEDETVNRLNEALLLFEEICNLEWFDRTSIILFLNKRDLFAEKIKKVPLKDFFVAFEGENNYENGCEFMTILFEERNQQEKDVYTHITCATDTGNVSAVFNAVKDIIIKKGLTRAGLM